MHAAHCFHFVSRAALCRSGIPPEALGRVYNMPSSTPHASTLLGRLNNVACTSPLSLHGQKGVYQHFSVAVRCLGCAEVLFHADVLLMATTFCYRGKFGLHPSRYQGAQFTSSRRFRRGLHSTLQAALHSTLSSFGW